MSEEYNNNQIIRKDAKGCFVESVNDSFDFGKIHLTFATYDVSKPAGQRQTNNISIYISVGEFLELCRKLEFGELRFILDKKKKANDESPIFETIGGTSAENLAKYNKSRPDGLSLSRTAKLIIGNKGFRFVASSGPGTTNETGLIVPLAGAKSENYVSVPLTFEDFSELILLTKAHYQAWLSAWYNKNNNSHGGRNNANS